MNTRTLAFGIFATAVYATAATPTFYKDVLPILQKNCQTCHRPGEIAPFSLLSYDDAVANRQMIAEVVSNETMPPWYAAGSHGQFQNDSSLTDEQRRALLAWVAAGGPAGNLSQAPEPPPAPDSEWRIGKPDMVISIDRKSVV